MNCIRGLLLLLLCFFSIVVCAQVPSDLSSVKAFQISDNQLQQYLNQARAKWPYARPIGVGTSKKRTASHRNGRTKNQNSTINIKYRARPV
jgi:hypothetical protein